MEDIRQRNLNLRRYKKSNVFTIKKRYSISVLNLFASYAISTNSNITRQGLSNIRRLVELLDLNEYVADDEKMKRIEFIKKALEAKLDYNLQNKDVILSHINGGLINDDELELSNAEISNEEIEWVDSSISNALKYAHLYRCADDMIDVGTRMKSDNVNEDIVNDFEMLIVNASAELRKVTPDMSRNNKFSLRDGVFEEKIAQTYNTLKSKNNKLKTNMAGLNALLKGGFERSRVYLLLGVTGGGKSMSLLNIAYQMKKANKGFTTNDPTKRPAIVYMTMENNIQESINRLFKISTGREDMTNMELHEVIAAIRNEGNLALNDDVGYVDLLMEYVPAKGINTEYMRSMIESYEEEGYEIICFVQDHIKKLRSSAINPNNDLRIELGDIINEMKVIAADKNIPVITNSHLNRDANRKLEEAAQGNRTEKIRLIQRDNVGESLLMLDNTDVGMAITIEDTAVSEKYMGFKLLKSRDGVGLNTDTIFQPFTDTDGIKLTEDADKAIPLYKSSLLGDGETQTSKFSGVENITVSPYAINNMADLHKSLDTSSDNIYSYSEEE